ncbi:MAG: DUF3048 domain-containing protein [Actinomycetota bacterium]
MKLSGFATGLCAFLLIACAADAPDTYAAKDPDSTGLESRPTTTDATSVSAPKDDQSSDATPTSVPDSPPTANSEKDLDGPVANEPVAPYRGTPVDPSVLLTPQLALKIDNAASAVPQQGIQEADIVFEELVEGGLTRFLAIFQSQVPEFVGPIRSGRSSDIPLLMPFDGALFGWSGSNWAFRRLLETVAITDVGLYRNPSQYWRKGDRPAPSNLWARAKELLGEAEDNTLPVEPLWPFRESIQKEEAGRKVRGVKVDWGSVQVSFRWVEDKNNWQRFQNEDKHLALDRNGDQVEVAPQNVIIQFTKYLLTNEVDANGARIPVAELSEGSGTAWILKDGQITEGRWVKPNITVHTQFVDETGKAIAMAPGSTWVLLAPRGTATILEIDD